MSDPQSQGIDRRTPPVDIGGYHLLERIGAGALGEVYRARDSIHGRTVTIKRVPAALTSDPVRQDLLSRTTTALTHVSHPGVATLYECGVDSGEMFIAQEFVPGQSLTTLVAGRPINARRAVELAVEIADALAALHANGLTHGDLRPDNIFVTPKGHAKLIDAGLASFTRGGSLRQAASSRLGALASDTLPVVRYLAPEQALGEGGDARSDIFALGLVLHEMLTGKPAFERPTADETLLAIVSATAPPPSSVQAKVTADLDRIVARALARPLDQRYQSASTMSDELRVVKTELEDDFDDMPPAEPARTERSRSHIWWLVPLVALLGGAIAWLMLNGS